MSAVALLEGFAADRLLGDPRRWHPVAGFGTVAARAERAIYAPTRRRGVVYASVLVLAAAGLTEVLARATGPRGRSLVLVVVTWAALGGRSLTGEATKIARLLEAGDLPAARRALPALVGRDAEALDESDVCRAVVESVAENTSDAVVGALLWGAVAGPAGVVAFRAANTLDAMVGHRNERYASFGWGAARLDDAMGWPAARTTAVLAAACAPVVGGSPRASVVAIRRDGAAHPSPNAGRVEAAFAGALGIRLGGRVAYDGRVEERPFLGAGPPPDLRDVSRAVRLSIAVGFASALLAASIRHLARGRWAR